MFDFFSVANNSFAFFYTYNGRDKKTDKPRDKRRRKKRRKVAGRVEQSAAS